MLTENAFPRGGTGGNTPFVTLGPIGFSPTSCLSTAIKPRWSPNRHQDGKMRAHDDPVVETPDFLLAALERANEAVVIVDRDLRVTHFNEAPELIWQLDRAEAL